MTARNAYRHRGIHPRWRLLLGVALAAVLIPISAHSINREALEGGTKPSSTPTPTTRSSTARTARTPAPGGGIPMAGFSGFGAAPDSAGGDSVVYQADQIEYDFDDEVIILTGNARIEYQEMVLEAHSIQFEVRNDIVVAEALQNPDHPDSVTGLPRFTSGVESFTGHRLTYNIQTRKGVVEGAASESPEGIYYGDVVKRTGDEQLDVRNGIYTTCDHEHPHYAFRSSKMRVLVGDKVIADPVVVEVAEVPVMWLPYGVFFVDQDRRSGFLAPTMGENSIDGRYMEGLGYYIAPNDYFGAQGLFSINEKRNYQWRFSTQYAWRYRLSGAIAYSYHQNWGATGKTLWSVNANHKQDLTPRSNLNASVNYTSSTQPQASVGESQAAIISQTLTSSMGYTARTIDGQSVTANANLTKNLQSGRVSATLPRVSVNSGQRYFFAQEQQRGPRSTESAREPEWWRKLGYNWSWSGTNSYLRGPSDKDIFDTWIYEEPFADSTITYRLVLTEQINTGYDGTYYLVETYESGGSLSLADGTIRIIGNGSDALWLFTGDGQDSTRAYIDDGGGGDRLIATVPGFSNELEWKRAKITAENTKTTTQSIGLSMPLPTPRWLNLTPSAGWSANWYSEPQVYNGDTVVTARQTYRAAISSSMNAYGTYPVNAGPIVAFRHVVTPSLSASYNLTRQLKETDYVFGGTQVGGDTSRVISAGLNNVFQMKALRNGEEIRFDRLLTLNTGISYNIDADGRHWSDPTTSATISPTKNFDVRLSARHSFYKTDSLGQDTGFDFLDPTLQSMNLTSNFSLAGGGRSSSNPGDEGFVGQQEDTFDRRGLELTEDERARLADEQSGSRWSPGWNVNLRHTYSWTRPRTSATTPVRTNVLDISLDVAPFEDWQVGYTTRYDFVDDKRIGDTMNIVRRLHCWEAKLDWVMKGARKGYYFQIYVTGLPDVKIQSKSDTGIRY